jgi:hypothetical protein
VIAVGFIVLVVTLFLVARDGWRQTLSSYAASPDAARPLGCDAVSRTQVQK